MASTMSSAQVRSLLQELAKRLDLAGISVGVRVVGGAALAGIRDSDDIEFLLAMCGVTCVQDAQEIYERYHAQDVLDDSAVARVEHWLSRPATTM